MTFGEVIIFMVLLSLSPMVVDAATEQVWQRALQSGDARDSALMLQSAAGVLSESDPWRSRMLVAAELYTMRAEQAVRPSHPLVGRYGVLATGWLQQNPAPAPERVWVVATVATLLPGAGHLLLHRWRDALVVAVMVWPMIGLTLWAARRAMGPVTLFFTMIATWLWSGSVFSAISLAKRGGLESYEVWWRALWHAAGLPGSP
ncbi:MAG: hypothetical protein Q9M13_10130 [Mariprofundales bacterium]|nr:hypothetical protein [Mariprofundales bacterium]